jgi:hypothetical protein
LKRNVSIAFMVLMALCIGMVSGIFIGKSKVMADNTFWQGTANGIILADGAVAQPITPIIQIAPDSVGLAYYLPGQQFDLKSLMVGQTTSINLYVRNNTKTQVNVYPVINPSPNIEVQSPMSNARLYPGGWAQFPFIIKATAIGPCSVGISFARD